MFRARRLRVTGELHQGAGVVDVSVLLAAHLAQHPHHDVALAFLDRALTDDAVLVPDPVWVGFVRIATSPRLFETPSTLAAVTAFVGAVTGSPGYREAGALGRGLGDFLDLCGEANAVANLIPDAYIATVAMRHGCPVATFDRDFRRFDDLTVVMPGSGASRE